MQSPTQFVCQPLSHAAATIICSGGGGARYRRAMRLRIVFSTVALCALASASCATPPASRDIPKLGALIVSDDFRHGLDQWVIELEQPGSVRAADGVLDIDVPAGATLWFKHELSGPISIVFDATAIAAGGENDRVSDMNTFWMATNKGEPAAPFAQPRSGKFADYNDLLTYYVGLGGNSNTTTRFRRYIGDPATRPLLPEHDLSNAQSLLTPNKKQTITLIANGTRIEYWRDGVKLLSYDDPAPYNRGWFAIRTVQSHLRIERLRIHATGPEY